MLFTPVKMQEVDLVAGEEKKRKSVSGKIVVCFVRRRVTGLINTRQSSRRGQGRVEEEVGAEKVLVMLVDRVVRLIMRVDRVLIELPLKEVEHLKHGLRWMKNQRRSRSRSGF